MLSIFPSILFLSGLAPFVIRLALGATLLYFGFINIKKYRKYTELDSSKKLFTLIIGLFEMASGFFIFVGLFTQLFALIAFIISIFFLIKEIRRKNEMGNINTSTLIINILLTATSLSLIFSGAGLLAFDWPF